MFVCICHEVTDSDIKTAAENGARSIRDLRHSLSVGATCGRCTSCAKTVLGNSQGGMAKQMHQKSV